MVQKDQQYEPTFSGPSMGLQRPPYNIVKEDEPSAMQLIQYSNNKSLTIFELASESSSLYERGNSCNVSKLIFPDC